MFTRGFPSPWTLQSGLPCYDTQYALRLCMEQGLEEASVHIYAAMGLYEEAVDLALKVRSGAACLGS